MDVHGAITQLGGYGVTGLIGYLGGIFSEPFKKKLLIGAERKRLRNSLYSELGTNLSSMLFYQLNRLKTPPGYYPEIAGWLRTEVYKKALEEPILFHEIGESKIFVGFFTAVSFMQDKPFAEQNELINRLRDYIHGEVEKGGLSRRKIAAHFLPGSIFEHPVKAWLRRRYTQVTHRNISKHPSGTILRPTGTLWKEVKAVWRGSPEIKARDT
jgi:hypothetical protein